jgi:DNA-binding protein HU-beta
MSMPPSRSRQRKGRLLRRFATKDCAVDPAPSAIIVVVAAGTLPAVGKGPMNKQDLIGQVTERTGLSRAEASQAIETMLDVITDALRRGDEVRLVGFGNFVVTRRKASVGRNPRTGEPLQIDSTTQPKFRAGKLLKEAVQ